jgi:DNA-binding SARP family transcriptional activator
MFELLLLGPLELRGPDGEDLPQVLAHPKRLAVLAYLILFRPGRFVSRDHLLALFWPDADESHARNSLSQILHGLRGDLGTELIQSRGRREVGALLDLIRCDVLDFREVVKAGDHDGALQLYRGDLLQGFHLPGTPGFDEWLECERERHREAAAEAAWAVAHHHLREGRLLRAERTAQQALELTWSDESQVREFILALAKAGDRAAAVRFFERFEDRLWDQLVLEPSPRTRKVVEEIRGWR